MSNKIIDFRARYEDWIENDFFDEQTTIELESIKNDIKEIEDRFYQDLNFGTAGLRGKIGAGTNRMNKYIVARATQGLAEVIKKEGKKAMEMGVVIAFDNRHFSPEFSMTTALTLCANGIKTYLFESLRSTPELSYAVRKLKTISGIVVTASHNPKEYNGYKVYWEEGSQILSETAKNITKNILAISDYSSIPTISEEKALEKGLLVMVGKELDDAYIKDTKNLSLRDSGIDKDIKIVYTPLNGAGNVPVRRILRERGFTNVFVVKEQENPDPNFTTVKFPNPEDTRAFEYSEKLGKEVDADILIATDPDSDRLAVEIKNKEGGYTPLNGNQTGVLLTEYVLSTMAELNTIPKNGAIVKSIVTGDLSKEIATHYNVKTFDVLTGFKNIFALPNIWDNTKEYSFILGYEESIGFCIGDKVRDKDAVNAAMFLAEAAAYYKSKNLTLLDVLNNIFKKYGYYKEELVTFVLEGKAGQERIGRMMTQYRDIFPKSIEKSELLTYIDYNSRVSRDIKTGKESKIDIDKTNALKFKFSNGLWYALRPSGTEPKIKLYLYTKGETEEVATENLNKMKEMILKILNGIE